ncbi:Piso0_001419 [Millerozyma farinosa CBS 7064]|uniref:Piso0_001419 protein n=1 Tax=Pichia sorbitophila (strain ATCC MYA-4447 / BCRC 22081 / CBS 7064 / NBRC 10061 / NRRL Y-12695) TaxID=559304 RepID=G8YN44_PICSO|nr:Piso0_001419 [Millerozyma farinosa CBS 7064]
MSVLIVGCGVMGLSTALELSKNGYKVTAIDAYAPPSPWSAANDLNKIIRTEYSDMIYTKLSVEAMDLWRNDATFKPAFNECGRVLVTPESHLARKDFEAKGIANLKKIEGQGTKIEYIKGGEGLAKKFPVFSSNKVHSDAELKWNPESGLGISFKALELAYQACVSLGVNFSFGASGEATKIITDDNKDYVITADGSRYTADKIVVSMGASTGKLIDLKQQQSATGLFLTHMQLNEEEFQKYKDMPIIFDSEMGFFFPPDPESKILKIALPGTGAHHMIKSNFRGEMTSLPRYMTEFPSDTIPVDGPEKVRNLIEKYIPELVSHQLINHKTCWIGDTSDSHYIIDKVPYLSYTYIASGDSGHVFKLLPNIGKYIVARLDNNLDQNLQQVWKWRTDLEAFDPAKTDWRVPSEDLDFADIEWVKKPEL